MSMSGSDDLEGEDSHNKENVKIITNSKTKKNFQKSILTIKKVQLKKQIRSSYLHEGACPCVCVCVHQVLSVIFCPTRFVRSILSVPFRFCINNDKGVEMHRQETETMG